MTPKLCLFQHYFRKKLVTIRWKIGCCCTVENIKKLGKSETYWHVDN